MKNPVSLLVIFLISLAVNFVIAEEKAFTFPSGRKSTVEMFQSEVLKVYSAKDNGAKYRAYVIKWKDQEVIATDLAGRTDNAVGDVITVSSQCLELPNDEKALIFSAVSSERVTIKK